jgi:RNA polymerase sigma-70 factor (ECF subfamily)
MNPVNSVPALSLDRYRLFLEEAARKDVSAGDCGDLSGVVQQTLLEARRAREQFARLDEAGQLAWLQKALANKLAAEARRQKRQRGDGEGSQTQDATIDAPLLAAEQTSCGARVVPTEDARRLSEALALLPEPERQAVVLHLLDRLTVGVVTQRLGRTKLAVVGLLRRALAALHHMMNEA